MSPAKIPARVTVTARQLSAAKFHCLSDVPPEVEWFKTSATSTKRAYENAIKDFMMITGIERPEEFRDVTRAHLIAWRDDLGERWRSELDRYHHPALPGAAATLDQAVVNVVSYRSL